MIFALIFLQSFTFFCIFAIDIDVKQDKPLQFTTHPSLYANKYREK